MAISIGARLESYFQAYVLSETDMLAMTEVALLAAGKLFLDQMLPMRFEAEAHRRLGFQYRSKKWNEWKYRGRIPPDGFYNRQLRKHGLGNLANAFTLITPHPRGEARPFDSRGQLKDFTLGRRDQLLANAQVLGKSKGATLMTLRIKMPYPHPVRSEYAHEITDIAPGERRRLEQRIHQSIREQVAAGNNGQGYAARAGVRFGTGVSAGVPILNAA